MHHRAIFRSSLGKLSEFPRAVDFRANVALSTTQQRHVLGECLRIRYHYVHDMSTQDQMYSVPSTPVQWPHGAEDWMGVFWVPPGEGGDTADERGRVKGSLSTDGRVCLNEELEFDVASTSKDREMLVGAREEGRGWCAGVLEACPRASAIGDPLALGL